MLMIRKKYNSQKSQQDLWHKSICHEYSEKNCLEILFHISGLIIKN